METHAEKAEESVVRITPSGLMAARLLSIYVDRLDIWSLTDEPERTAFFCDALYTVVVSPWDASPALLFSHLQGQWYSASLGRCCTFPVKAQLVRDDIRRVYIEPKQLLIVTGASPATIKIHVYLCRLLRSSGKGQLASANSSRHYFIMESHLMGFETLALGDLLLTGIPYGTCEPQPKTINLHFVTAADLAGPQSLLPHSVRIQCTLTLESISFETVHHIPRTPPSKSLRRIPQLLEHLSSVQHLLKNLVLSPRSLSVGPNIYPFPVDNDGTRHIYTKPEDLLKCPFALAAFWHEELLSTCLQPPTDVTHLRKLFDNRFQSCKQSPGIMRVDELRDTEAEYGLLTEFTPDQKIPLLCPPGARSFQIILIVVVFDSVLGWAHFNILEQRKNNQELRTNQEITCVIYKNLTHKLIHKGLQAMRLQPLGYHPIGSVKMILSALPGSDLVVPDFHPDRDRSWMSRTKKWIKEAPDIFGENITFPILKNLFSYHRFTKNDFARLAQNWECLPSMFQQTGTLKAGVALMREHPGHHCLLPRESPCLTDSSAPTTEGSSGIENQDIEDHHPAQNIVSHKDHLWTPASVRSTLLLPQDDVLVSPSHCLLEGSVLQGGRVQDLLCLIVKTFNCRNEPIKSGGALIRLHFVLEQAYFPVSMGATTYRYVRTLHEPVATNFYPDVSKFCVKDVPDTSVWWQVEDDDSGVYKVHVRHAKAGRYLLSVLVNGLPAAGTPLKITFRSGALDPGASEIIGLQNLTMGQLTLDVATVKEIAACLIYWQMNKDNPSLLMSDIVGVHVRDLILGEDILRHFVSEFQHYSTECRNKMRILLRDSSGGLLHCKNYNIDLRLSSRAQLQSCILNDLEGGVMDVDFTIPVSQAELGSLLEAIPESKLAAIEEHYDDNPEPHDINIESHVPEYLREVLVDVQVDGQHIGGSPVHIALKNLAPLCVWYKRISPWLQVVKPLLPERVMELINRRETSSQGYKLLLEDSFSRLRNFLETTPSKDAGESIDEMQKAWQALTMIRQCIRQHQMKPRPERITSAMIDEAPLILKSAFIAKKKDHILLRARHWQLTEKMMSQGTAALIHLRESLAQMAEVKTRTLRQLIEKFQNGELETIGQVITNYTQINEEMQKLYRPGFKQVAADHLLRYLEMNELSLMEASASRREKKLAAREQHVSNLEKNLKRVWNNFTESVIQFPPKITTIEDCMGLADDATILEPKTDKDRDALVRVLREKREAANVLRDELAQIWSVDKLDDGSPVASMLEAEQRIQSVTSKFLTQLGDVKSNSSILLNKGIQAERTLESETILQSPVGALVLKRRLRAERDDTNETQENDKKASIIVGVTKVLVQPIPLKNINDVTRRLKSLPETRRTIRAIFRHYSNMNTLFPNGMAENHIHAGIGVNQFWLLIDGLQLPAWWRAPEGSQLLLHLYEKFSPIERVKEGATMRSAKRLKLPMWNRFLGDLSHYVVVSMLAATTPEVKKVLQRFQSSLTLPFTIPSRMATFYIFVKNFLVPLYNRLLSTNVDEGLSRRSLKRCLGIPREKDPSDTYDTTQALVAMQTEYGID